VEAEHSPLQSLSVVLARRGYELVRTREALVEGEVFRVAMSDDGAVAVVSRDVRPKLEVELVVELVVELLQEAARGALDGRWPEPGGNGGQDQGATGTDRSAGPGGDGAAPPISQRIIGRSPAMLELFALVDRLATTSSTSVLIQGENGTGKELVAHAIHQSSPRRERRFVVTNCSAFNDNLLDSELFGHARGAFTGATNDKPGLFEAADLGTFFLDEIGDMSPALQAKVLRVLQDGTFNRVGDPTPRQVDVRIIAATNRDLVAMIQTGEFREDLYYRINVVNLVVPPLRMRRDDIPLLIQTFLDRLWSRRPGAGSKTLSPACQRRMLEYPWPGNVRELENEVERLVVLAGEAKVIDVDLLTPRIRDATVGTGKSAPANPESLPEAVESLEREMIAAALLKYRGNKSRAAQALQVSRRNLIRLVQKYHLDRS
jgi:transcriptional regulator with PAS, ATPase and Fis domain